MNIKVKNVLICTPCADSVNVVAMRGIFDIFIHFSQAQSIEYLKKAVNEGQTSLAECYKLSRTGIMNVGLNGLEVFICNSQQLRAKKFKNVFKRSILLPLNMKMEKLDYLFLTGKDAKLLSNKTTIDVKLDKTSFKISFSDLTLLNQTVALLMEDMKQPEVEVDGLQVDEKKHPVQVAKEAAEAAAAAAVASEEEKIKQELNK